MGQRERTLEMAQAFLTEVRRDLERATVQGADLPPRIRTMHTRPGHATPEYRTLAIPAPPGGGVSPEVLSLMIASYARARQPCSLVLALDAVTGGETTESQPVLIAEARDRSGTRLYLMQPFRIEEGVLKWGDPVADGWQDPGDQELILDASFPDPAPAPATAPATSDLPSSSTSA